MSYAYQQGQESQNQQVQEAPQTAAPAEESAGNAARTEDAGLTGGLAAQAMDLTGPMADMILDCMPLGKAMAMAGPIMDNPVVEQWASNIDMGRAIEALGEAATDKLLSIWPVGTGLDAEGEIAGQIVGGVAIHGKASAIRSGAKSVQFDSDLYQGLELGTGVGAEVTNAFDETVAAAISTAGITVGVRATNQLTATLDIMQILRSAADLKQISLAQILMGELPARGILDMGANPINILQGFADQLSGMEWTREEAVEIGGEARASGGAVDGQALFGVFPTALPIVGDLIQGIAPMLELCAGLETRILPAGFPQVEVHNTGSLSGVIHLLSATPAFSGLISDAALNTLSGPMGASLGATLKTTAKLLPGLMEITDPANAMLTLTGASESGGLSVIDGIEIPVQELSQYLQAGGDLDEILAAGAAPTISRTVGLDVPIAQLSQIFPGWVQDIIPEGAQGTFTDQMLRLEGTATLPGEALMCLQGRGIQTPGAGLAVMGLADIAAAAIGISMGHGHTPTPEWLAGHEDALMAIGQHVQMGPARLVGHIHLGAGGGITMAELGKAEGEVRTEGGLVVDKVVDGTQAQQVMRALSGQEAA